MRGVSVRRLDVDGDVLTIDVQKAGGEETEQEQDGVKCVLPCVAARPVSGRDA